jgi:hypothetical protein
MWLTLPRTPRRNSYSYFVISWNTGESSERKPLQVVTRSLLSWSPYETDYAGGVAPDSSILAVAMFEKKGQLPPPGAPVSAWGITCSQSAEMGEGNTHEIKYKATISEFFFSFSCTPMWSKQGRRNS